MARNPFQTLTEPMFYILLALREECSGVDVMARVEEISHGRVRVGPGTLYALLPKLEDAGLIARTREEGRQKWYVLTGIGSSMLETEVRRLRQMLADAEGAVRG